MAATDKRASELTAPVSIKDADTFPGYRPGTGGEPNLDIRATAGLIRAPIIAGLASGDVAVGALTPSAATAIPPDIQFPPPFQTIWTMEFICDNAGSASVTEYGINAFTEAVEIVGSVSLAAGQTDKDDFEKYGYSSFSWTKTGTGAVTARVL